MAVLHRARPNQRLPGCSLVAHWIIGYRNVGSSQPAPSLPFSTATATATGAATVAEAAGVALLRSSYGLPQRAYTPRIKARERHKNWPPPWPAAAVEARDEGEKVVVMKFAESHFGGTAWIAVDERAVCARHAERLCPMPSVMRNGCPPRFFPGMLPTSLERRRRQRGCPPSDAASACGQPTVTLWQRPWHVAAATRRSCSTVMAAVSCVSAIEQETRVFSGA